MLVATLGFSVSFAKIFSRKLKCAHPSYQLVESKEFSLYLCVLCKVRCDCEKSLPGFHSRAFSPHCVCCLDVPLEMWKRVGGRLLAASFLTKIISLR